MSISEKMALAARLHILLLHKTGRVTDTEWMARNREYAEEIIRFSIDHAQKENHHDLGELAEKFAAVMFPNRSSNPNSYQPAYEKPALGHYAGAGIGANPMRYIGGIR